MKSGVYSLTFKDGSLYVGKTINFERRWKEHADSMCAGRAPKAIQAAYAKNGYPKAKILVQCHSDHIDLLETYYICKLQPTLNTVGGLAINNKDLNILEEHNEWLQVSTVDHLKMLLASLDELAKLKQLNQELKEFTDDSVVQSSLWEQVQIKNIEIEKLKDQLEDTELAAMTWESRAKSSWIKRMFKKW